MNESLKRVVITDLDNTLFDWVSVARLLHCDDGKGRRD
jgi:hypothetical protein